MVNATSLPFLFALLCCPLAFALLVLAQNQSDSVSCPKKNNVLVPVLATVGGLIGLQLIAVLIYWCLRPQKRNIETESKHPSNSLEERRRFTYSEILKITNDFERIIARGEFGNVYHGYIDDTQVTVKMFHPISVDHYDQFQAEVKILLRIHHRNLTSIFGYCNEGTNLAIIFEFIPNGNLEEYSSEHSSSILSWEQRLRIGIGIAKGLEYLHDACIPPIIHTNLELKKVLLTEGLEAKLAGFGLSRLAKIMRYYDSPISELFAGTPGYLDPEYYVSSRLSVKADVYSFGLILLVMITGRPVISRAEEIGHISHWVSYMLEQGSVRNVIDPRLGEDSSKDSIVKAVELAMACVSLTSSRRPTMSQVVSELKGCFALELAPANESPLSPYHGSSSTERISLSRFN